MANTSTDLGSVLGGASYARAINAAGQVVGYSYNASGTDAHAFVWLPALDPTNFPGIPARTMVDLGTLPGQTVSRAYAISDDGHVFGAGFLWTASGRMQAIAIGGFPMGVNGAGQVAGTYTDEYGYRRARVLPPPWLGSAINLGTLYWANESRGFDINDTGQVVRHSGVERQDWRPFLVTPTTDGNGNQIWFMDDGSGGNALMIDLSTAVSLPAGWQINGPALGSVEAPSINSTAQVVGTGTLNGQQRAYLLTPITP